jgi:co-chaperonin GroES (HSP10)
MALGKMKHEVDPREEIMRQLYDLPTVDVFNDMVLVAVYERPDKTAGGLILADQTKQEDRYQGKAALVVKLGPLVNAEAEVRGGELAVGDWIAIRPSDGWAVSLNQKLCRLVSEKGIHLRIPSPDSVY